MSYISVNFTHYNYKFMPWCGILPLSNNRRFARMFMPTFFAFDFNVKKCVCLVVKNWLNLKSSILVCTLLCCKFWKVESQTCKALWHWAWLYYSFYVCFHKRSCYLDGTCMFLWHELKCWLVFVLIQILGLVNAKFQSYNTTNYKRPKLVGSFELDVIFWLDKISPIIIIYQLLCV